MLLIPANALDERCRRTCAREANLGLSRATIARAEVHAEALARELALSLDDALHFFA